MAKNDVFKQKLVSYIQDAYAMENEIAQVLQRQIDVTGDQPELQAKLTQHLAETELQRKRMAQRLEAYGEQPSMIKGATSMVMGNVVGLTGAMRPDMLSRNMRDDYVTEHLEIAAYTLLIASAQAYGDMETVRLAEQSLREEIAMAQWIFERLPMTALVDLQAQGADVDAAAIAGAGPALRVTFEPLKDVQDARKASHGG